MISAGELCSCIQVDKRCGVDGMRRGRPVDRLSAADGFPNSHVINFDNVTKHQKYLLIKIPFTLKYLFIILLYYTPLPLPLPPLVYRLDTDVSNWFAGRAAMTVVITISGNVTHDGDGVAVKKKKIIIIMI